MILMPRRTFFGLCILTAGTAAFLLLAVVVARHGHGPVADFARHPFTRRAATAAADGFCPAITDHARGDDQGAIAAYLSIMDALEHGSLEQVPENAARIALVFGDINPDIAGSARRLSRLRDLAGARREFEQLTVLFSRSPGAPADADKERAPDARALEV